jgi:hypothetical protein
VKQHGSTPLIATWLLAIGLVLISSGWGPALTRMLQSRPEWSVCGQSLCDCRPVPVDPDCPLCLAGDPGGAGCEGVGIDADRIPLAPAPDSVWMARLGEAGEGLLIALTLLVGVPADRPHAPARGLLMPADGWSLPESGHPLVPTPPPRA